MSDKEEELLSDPTGGPSAKNVESSGSSDEDVDPSAGAGGQDEGEGAVEEAHDSTGEDKPTPG